MKRSEEWGSDEWVTLAVLGVFVLGACKVLRRWASHNGVPWLIGHRILLRPGQGLVHLGQLGSLDLPRLALATFVLVLLGLLVQWAVGASIRQIKDKQDRARTQAGQQLGR